MQKRETTRSRWCSELVAGILGFTFLIVHLAAEFC